MSNEIRDLAERIEEKWTNSTRLTRTQFAEQEIRKWLESKLDPIMKATVQYDSEGITPPLHKILCLETDNDLCGHRIPHYHKNGDISIFYGLLTKKNCPICRENSDV